jgi:hypothetical protein
MNPVSTALTVAWLDAFRRLAATKTLLDAIELPDGQSRTLTDAIEGALRSTAESAERMVKIEAQGRALDILA